MDSLAENNQQELRRYLARHALRIAEGDAVGTAASDAILVEARTIAERLASARALLHGLAALTILSPEAFATIDDKAEPTTDMAEAATAKWRAFHAALLAGDTGAQLGAEE